MGKIVAFGEIMMRLNPAGYGRFVQAREFEVSFAGSEANVAACLAGFGEKAAFVSKLPTGEIGQMALNDLRRVGVDVSHVGRAPGRIGVFFLEKGASQRASKVIYDRANSAAANAKPGDFDWDAIFEDADWFHFTGITPALSPEMPRICMEACQAAKRRGLTVSCDPNFRESLWTRERARQVMAELMPYVDVFFSNVDQVGDILGIFPEETGLPGEEAEAQRQISVARQLTRRYGLQKVAFTNRKSFSATENGWSGMLYSRGEAFFSRKYRITIVDRVGSGDSFAGGLIYSLRRGDDEQNAIEFATAASCLKHTIEQDYDLVSVEEVEALAHGSGDGRIRR